MFIKNGKLESFIGINSIFKGDMNTKGTLRIDGTMDGNVNADWVVIGEKAFLKGDALARGIIVGGSVEGNLTAKETVEIKSKAQVLGDITTSKLSMTDGGIINGRVAMDRDESKIVDFRAQKDRRQDIQNI